MIIRLDCEWTFSQGSSTLNILYKYVDSPTYWPENTLTLRN